MIIHRRNSGDRIRLIAIEMEGAFGNEGALPLFRRSQAWSPGPRNAAVESSAVARMENFRAGRGPSVSDWIHRGSKTFVGQILPFQENGEPFLRSEADLESRQRVGIGQERVGLIDRVMGEVALHICSGVKTGRTDVEQFRFIKMLRDASDAVVPVNGITVEMKIVQRVGLTERQPIAGIVPFLLADNRPQ